MKNVDWEHLNSLLWTGDDTNIELAVTIAKGMSALPQWQTYQQLKQCVVFFEWHLRTKFSIGKLIHYVQANGIQIGYTEYPDCLAVLSPVVRNISLFSHNLPAIPSFVFQMRKVEDLNLAGNQLNELPDELFDLENLRVLNISYNHITSIPTAILRLSRLEELCYISDGYYELPDVLPQLPQLRRLVFGWGVAPSQSMPVPDIIFQCRNLTSLTIEGLMFKEIPAAIAQLTQLESFSVHEVYISDLPNELSLLLNLKELRIESTFYESYISELPRVIPTLRNLRSLYIRNTMIGTIPDEFANLQQLEYIEFFNINIPVESIPYWEDKLYKWLPNAVVHWDA